MNGLIIARSILLRAFVICVGILWLTAALYYGMKPMWVGLMDNWFQLNDPHTLDIIMLAWFSLAKLWNLMVFLIPGLAIHWTIQAQRKAQNAS